MKRKTGPIWPENWVVELLDLRDSGHTHKAIAERMTDRFEEKFTAAMVSGMLDRLKKGGFLR